MGLEQQAEEADNFAKSQSILVGQLVTLNSDLGTLTQRSEDLAKCLASHRTQVSGEMDKLERDLHKRIEEAAAKRQKFG